MRIYSDSELGTVARITSHERMSNGIDQKVQATASLWWNRPPPAMRLEDLIKEREGQLTDVDLKTRTLDCIVTVEKTERIW